MTGLNLLQIDQWRALLNDEKARLIQALEGWRDEDGRRDYYLAWHGRGRWCARLEGPGFGLAFAGPTHWGWHDGGDDGEWTLDALAPAPNAPKDLVRVATLIRRLHEVVTEN